MKILLGVSGSISAYKSYDLLRSLVKEGHEVITVTTKSGEKFVHPWLFKSLGAKATYTYADDFQKAKETDGVLHIELARWCDGILIAPASANFIADLSHGKATDLLSSIFLAISDERPVALFPAMNTKMLQHPFVKENIDKISKLKNVYDRPTASGTLACGEEGEGKLEDIDVIAETAPIIFGQFLNRAKNEKHYLITTGATISPLDPVRYLTNP